MIMNQFLLFCPNEYPYIDTVVPKLDLFLPLTTCFLASVCVMGQTNEQFYPKCNYQKHVVCACI